MFPNFPIDNFPILCEAHKNGSSVKFVANYKKGDKQESSPILQGKIILAYLPFL